MIRKIITIRKSKPEDTHQLEILFQLTRQHTFTSRPKDEFQIGDYVKSVEEDKVWVAEENEVIVGFVSIYRAHNFVHNLFVHPDHQRKGIGALLLQEAEAHLLRPITLKVAMDNLKACPFYQKQGWRQTSVHEDASTPYVLYKKD